MKLQINEQEFEKYFQDAIHQTMEIMKIKSIADESNPRPNAPFGEEVDKALMFALNLAKECGLKPKVGYNHEYGYADYGSGDKLFGIICHLDVVPSGDLSKWKKSPWVPIVENDELYGRGSLDDKGPTIINLFALKYLIAHGFMPKKYKVRVIFGLTEETTWHSIQSYLKHEQEPDIAYVPDGEWPVIYAEKGIMNFDLVGPGVSYLNMRCGDAYNVVCDVNKITGHDMPRLRSYFDEHHIEYTAESNQILAKGKAAHGSTPELGDNIGLTSLKALVDIMGDKAPQIAKFVHDHLPTGEFRMPKVFVNYRDETGEVSSNLGKLDLNEKEQRIGFNCRFPVKYQKEQIMKDIEKVAKQYDLKFEFKQWEPQKYIDQNSPIVEKMMKVYADVTGDTTAKPLAIGGGTYARALKNGIAFGACKSIDLMHNVNERISLKELRDMFKIYIHSINELID